VAMEGMGPPPPPLLDATGRRVVVQDGTGAIEVTIPTGDAAPPIGSRLRVEGRIGVAYGAPRLKADRITVAGTANVPAAIILHGQPGEENEWRLVTVSGRVESVHKLGDRWRAEIRVGSGLLPVVGQPGSGILATAVVEGRTATLTGIVRRPYPTATDRRFAILPRFPADLHLAPEDRGPAEAAAGAPGTIGAAAGGTDPGGSTVAAAGPTPPPGAVDADLADLASVAGVLVRVGGLVVGLESDGFTLDDGTSVGRVVLAGEAMAQLALIEPDDALNAVGRVQVTKDGPVVIVDAPGGISLAGDPVPAAAPIDPVQAATPEPTASATPGQPGSRLAGLGGGPWSLDAGVAGAGTLLLAAGLSVVMTLVRREHSRRRLTHRIGTRLARIAGPAPAMASASSAERGPSTPGSA
jgi:hypothetical protein